jgi:HSP20 family molecular chaperone IbpA
MRPIRNCFKNAFNSGVSKCQIEYGKIKGAIIVNHGEKLPAGFDADALAEACHADAPSRIYPVLTFVEYAKNGGEPQTSAVGYGPNQVTGLNAQTDTFTLDSVDYGLHAQILKSMNTPRDVYYFDENNTIYGINDGTDSLAGIPMGSVYSTITPHPTSGNKEQMTISFAHEDAEFSQSNYDYQTTDIDLRGCLVGLTSVDLVKDGNSYHIVEHVGGFDRTEEFGATIAQNASSVLIGASSASYANGVLTITLASGTTTVALAKPSVLYDNGIEGIVAAE